mmetsp:Transcript_59614/g.166438  ORF Transcript_59614/g.166438 Transcript_59614/m.166438 type:complete len:286 (-) Transcript_59614:78-935(-)
MAAAHLQVSFRREATADLRSPLARSRAVGVPLGCTQPKVLCGTDGALVGTKSGRSSTLLGVLAGGLTRVVARDRHRLPQWPKTVSSTTGLRSTSSTFCRAATADAARTAGSDGLAKEVSAKLWPAVSLLGASLAFGGNAWLWRYGPRLLRFCTSTTWLGKRAHRAIQAHLLPDYFRLLAVACCVAFVGHYMSPRAKETEAAEKRRQRRASISLAVGVATALVNCFALGPWTKMLLAVFEEGPVSTAAASAFLPLSKSTFYIVHAASLLIHLANFLALAIYISCRA